MNYSSALMKDALLEPLLSSSSLDDEINDILSNDDEFMTETMASSSLLPLTSDMMIFDEVMPCMEESLFSLDNDETDDVEDDLCSALFTPKPTMTVQEDLLVEPTPINTSLAVVVDRLPLEHLLRKQDLDKYDLFMRTFSSSLKTEQALEMTMPQPSFSSSSATSAVANMHQPNNSNNNNNNNNTFRPDMMFRNAHQNAAPWMTPLLVPVHSVREHILTHHHQHNLLPLSSIFSLQEQQQPLLNLNKNFFDLSNNDDDASFLEDEETNSFTTTMSVGSGDSVACGDDVATTSTGTNGSSSTNNHLRSMQMEQWNTRFQELVQFKQVFGHCLVPLNWPVNPPLGHWVKRQRYQYRIKHDEKNTVSKKSTLTDERQMALQQLGFIWDSHAANWEERLGELRDFKDYHGHTNVPKKYIKNPQLPVWVKCQRRQYKLFRLGKKSHMTQERIEKLKSLGFIFDPRPTPSTSTSPSSL